MIVEAVFEDMDVKKEIFKQLDQVAKPGALNPHCVCGCMLVYCGLACVCACWCVYFGTRASFYTKSR